MQISCKVLATTALALQVSSFGLTSPVPQGDYPPRAPKSKQTVDLLGNLENNRLQVHHLPGTPPSGNDLSLAVGSSANPKESVYQQLNKAAHGINRLPQRDRQALAALNTANPVNRRPSTG